MDRVKVAVGVDIGGTNTVFGFVDELGNCLGESSLPTNPGNGPDNLFDRLFEKINSSFSKFSEQNEIVGIGIGAPNANYYKGTIEQPPNLGWGIVNVLEIVKKYTAVPVSITNDANAAAIGEMIFGAVKGMENFIVITLGTGLGSGIVVNGELVYGADGFAGEIGHMIYDINGRECGCGRRGCLETYASASGIKRTVFELLAEVNSPSILRKFSFDLLTSKDIYDAAMKEDKIALAAFDRTAKILGAQLADVVACFSPEAIILFGGLANAGKLIFDPVKIYMEEFMLNIFKNKVRIIPSGLSNGNAAVLGSGALIWNEIKKKIK